MQNLITEIIQIISPGTKLTPKQNSDMCGLLKQYTALVNGDALLSFMSFNSYNKDIINNYKTLDCPDAVAYRTLCNHYLQYIDLVDNMCGELTPTIKPIFPTERLTDKEFIDSLTKNLNCYGDKERIGHAKCAFCPFTTACLKESTKDK